MDDGLIPCEGVFSRGNRRLKAAEVADLQIGDEMRMTSGPAEFRGYAWIVLEISPDGSVFLKDGHARPITIRNFRGVMH